MPRKRRGGRHSSPALSARALSVSAVCPAGTGPPLSRPLAHTSTHWPPGRSRRRTSRRQAGRSPAQNAGSNAVMTWNMASGNGRAGSVPRQTWTLPRATSWRLRDMAAHTAAALVSTPWTVPAYRASWARAWPPPPRSRTTSRVRSRRERATSRCTAAWPPCFRYSEKRSQTPPGWMICRRISMLAAPCMRRPGKDLPCMPSPYILIENEIQFI